MEVQLGPGQPITPAALPVSIVRGVLSFLQGGFGDTPVCPCGDHWPGFSCPVGEPRDWFCQFSRRSSNLGGLSHAGKLITSRFIQSKFATGDRLCRREDVAKATCPGKNRLDRGQREHEGLWEAVCGHRGSSGTSENGAVVARRPCGAVMAVLPQMIPPWFCISVAPSRLVMRVHHLITCCHEVEKVSF